ncbi:MAG TPA: sigma-54 dependent transcriptional regulator [Candidatus Binatia bacterium]|jgi:DNA-binding NtrC family response regulator|nr:sigma-54 dependent transcriptional regulator [Candidatus Binatia bacterium]
MGGTILLAEDEDIARKNIGRILQQAGHVVHEVGNGTAALDAINQTDFDVVLTDIKMPGADGLAVLKHVREVSPQTFTLIMTAFASVDTAVEALQLGAQDYLLKPIILDDLLRKIHILLEHKDLAWEVQQLRREVNRDADPAELMVGRTPAMQEVRALIDKVAAAPSTVLLTGESGVGKEVVARAIHLRSPRAEKIFLPVNCGAIPESLLESQLFGHIKGAFTGAIATQEGLFQHARGGTIFLDEISDMPGNLQVKLLRVLQEREVVPVGATIPVPVDVRVIAATNQDLAKEVNVGRFREDLYYRLNVIGVHIPPLRDRREDIPLLVEYLIRRHNQTLKTTYKGVERAALKRLMALPWKGNIRELDNVLERAMILGNGEWITPAGLPHEDSREESQRSGPSERRLKEAVQAYEKSHIEAVLHETKGDRTRAAELLGLSRSSLYRKMEQLGILDR